MQISGRFFRKKLSRGGQKNEKNIGNGGRGFFGVAFMQKIAGTQTADSNLIASFAFVIIPIVILWLGLGIAQSMSIAGAGAIVGKAQGFMKNVGNWTARAPFRGAWWGTKKLGGVADRKLAGSKHLWWASPTAFKTAWKENKAEKERKAFKPATGTWRDKLNSIRGEQTNFKDTATQNNIATKEKELKDTSEDSGYLTNEFNKAVAAKDNEKGINPGNTTRNPVAISAPKGSANPDSRAMRNAANLEAPPIRNGKVIAIPSGMLCSAIAIAMTMPISGK